MFWTYFYLYYSLIFLFTYTMSSCVPSRTMLMECLLEGALRFSSKLLMPLLQVFHAADFSVFSEGILEVFPTTSKILHTFPQMLFKWLFDCRVKDLHLSSLLVEIIKFIDAVTTVKIAVCPAVIVRCIFFPEVVQCQKQLC